MVTIEVYEPLNHGPDTERPDSGLVLPFSHTLVVSSVLWATLSLFLINLPTVTPMTKLNTLILASIF